MAVLIIALAVATGEVARGRRDYLAEAERRAVEAGRARGGTARPRAREGGVRARRGRGGGGGAPPPARRGGAVAAGAGPARHHRAHDRGDRHPGRRGGGGAG